MIRVLFLCTENAARSQMAEGLANHLLAGQVEAFSAGVRPARLNPYAVRVMAEIGLDIRGQWSKSIDDLGDERFDLVITVCDRAREQCPIFPGATRVLHLGLPDPARTAGSDAEILAAFRRVRDAIRGQIIPILREESRKAD